MGSFSVNFLQGTPLSGTLQQLSKREGRTVVKDDADGRSGCARHSVDGMRWEAQGVHVSQQHVTRMVMPQHTDQERPQALPALPRNA